MKILQKLSAFNILLTLSLNLASQTLSFEKEFPSNLQYNQEDKVSISDVYYKDGENCLQWSFNPHTAITIGLENQVTMTQSLLNRGAFYMWIYNENPANDSLSIELLTPNQEVAYRFPFRLVTKGWRACWMALNYMEKVGKETIISAYRIVAPNRTGTIYIDRLTFPVAKRHNQIRPDHQMPHNNARQLWPFYEWSQQEYDIPLLSNLTDSQQKELTIAAQEVDSFVREDFAYTNNKKTIDLGYRLFNSLHIQPSGKGYKGRPIVSEGEVNKEATDISLRNLNDMFQGLCTETIQNHSAKAVKDYLLLWDYAIDQGFAWGSGMGTIGNFSYAVRGIFTSAWLMREHIYKHKNGESILATLTYWSSLMETRKSMAFGRDALLDSWNTLLFQETLTAMLTKDPCQRYRAMQGLSRWVSQAILPTPGTLGGIKPDGCTFHHGGLYPAYTIGAFASIGRYVNITKNTSFKPTFEARLSLKKALETIRNYSNLRDCGIALGGRHPFGFTIGAADINLFAYLALAGDLTGEGKDIDYQLAADYMRLSKNTQSKEYKLFANRGIKPAVAPHGMFVYNYAATGIYRQEEWMVTLKGANTNVWGTEIFETDNRYGRYQSYGSVQIFGYPSRKESGYNQNGWDWNRLPGTTTIHLPWDVLDSKGWQMLRSPEEFAGSCHFNNECGIFAMKLHEEKGRDLTPDFVARKSVFCFGNRLICLGTGISNSNQKYPTETTLFQSTFSAGNTPYVNGNKVTEVGYTQSFTANNDKCISLRDGYHNYYFIKEGDVTVQIAKQESRHEKKRTPTWGTFSSAWINHGVAPQGEGYEYVIWIKPDAKEVKKESPLKTYKVIEKSNRAHIIFDKASKITAYVAFEQTNLKDDAVISEIDAETMLMLQRAKRKASLSVCSPNLNIEEKAYTTSQASKPIVKRFTLKGKWHLTKQNQHVNLTQIGSKTLFTVTLQHGIPCEITITKD